MSTPQGRRLAAAAALVLAVMLLVPAAAGAATHRLGAGTATFSLDPSETATLLGAGIAPAPISPSRLSFTTSAVRFRTPVSGGTWDQSAPHGTFLLKGGLTFVAPGSAFKLLALKGWRAGVNTAKGFSISANGTRSTLFFDENLMGSIPSIVTIHGVRYVKVTNVLLFYNATSAGAFTTALGGGPSAGDPFAAVTFRARLK